MDIDLLNIENDKVIPGIACYTVPQLKAILDNYSKEESIEIFTYLHFLYHPKSCYNNAPEHEREEQIINDIQTEDWDEEDQIIKEAKKFVEDKFLSPTRRAYYNFKAGLENLGNYVKTAKITDGKDGNLAALSVAYTRIGKTMEDFKRLEKMVEDEEKIQTRGDQEISDI